jgi:aryl-alcohol dehydrogenase-like predicted oxidoreductase
MNFTRLGPTGLKVSRLCLGTGNFGPYADEPESHAILDAALDSDINFLDTADIYGGGGDPQTGFSGVTESILGRWFQQTPARRDRVVLATKVWGPMGPGPNDRGLSAYHIRRACEDSLRRLQTDHIDLYQMHNYDPDVPLDEIRQAMERLIREGKVLHVGSSNWPAWEIARANTRAESRAALGIVSEQCCFNLACRRPELELLPAARKLSVGILPWGPLCGGLLAGVLKKTESGRRALPGMQRIIENRRDQLRRWETFCADLGHEPAHVALAWLLAKPEVTAPVLGPRKVEHVTQSLPVLDIRLDDEALKTLDEIWPPVDAGPSPYTLH